MMSTTTTESPRTEHDEELTGTSCSPRHDDLWDTQLRSSSSTTTLSSFGSVSDMGMLLDEVQLRHLEEERKPFPHIPLHGEKLTLQNTAELEPHTLFELVLTEPSSRWWCVAMRCGLLWWVY
jgi:hypothetical protein